MSLPQLHASAKEHSSALRGLLSELSLSETAANQSPEVLALTVQITRHLALLSDAVGQIRAAARFAVPAERPLWLRRVRTLTDSLTSFQAELAAYSALVAREQEAQNRDQFFAQLVEERDGVSAQQRSADGLRVRQGPALTVSDVSRQLDEMLEQGGAALTDLRVQGDRLKATRRKLLDISTRLTVGGRTLSRIARMETSNCIVVGVGCAMSLFIFFGVRHLLHS
jgi:hypothetical protein